MKTATELARELQPGPELNALFFETCYPDTPPPTAHDETTGETVDVDWPSVTDDAAVCEAWAMRWARENGFIWRIEQRGHRCRCEFWGTMKQRLPLPEYGDDWKHALVRACIAAAEQLNPKGAEHGN